MRLLPLVNAKIHVYARHSGVHDRQRVRTRARGCELALVRVYVLEDVLVHVHARAFGLLHVKTLVCRCWCSNDCSSALFRSLMQQELYFFGLGPTRTMIGVSFVRNVRPKDKFGTVVQVWNASMEVVNKSTVRYTWQIKHTVLDLALKNFIWGARSRWNN